MPVAEQDAHLDKQDEEYTMPSMEALLAGTFALMTGYAQSARDCPHRACMARKLVSNLMVLSAHPQLSPAMQIMLANLRTRWQVELENAADTAAAEMAPTALWHAVPARMQ
ncbi:hypothetical protein [Hydrogenophaga sp.]|uniref:hypothetical protein n=1 Tax=Hydrogenophaga sp. TaxID=1904254 RepID=UPI002719809E|nr:hypothetical protein [Hydrogenophaga sp.]MDO9438986.1 hypothetical protein [Hydrogenophaga sp.]